MRELSVLTGQLCCQTTSPSSRSVIEQTVKSALQLAACASSHKMPLTPPSRPCHARMCCAVHLWPTAPTILPQPPHLQAAEEVVLCRAAVLPGVVECGRLVAVVHRQAPGYGCCAEPCCHCCLLLLLGWLWGQQVVQHAQGLCPATRCPGYNKARLRHLALGCDEQLLLLLTAARPKTTIEPHIPDYSLLSVC